MTNHIMFDWRLDGGQPIQGQLVAGHWHNTLETAGEVMEDDERNVGSAVS
jgi:hypothetical protein